VRPSDACDWCGGTGLSVLYRRGYTGHGVMSVEETDEWGEVIWRRVPGTIAIHCRACTLGEYRYGRFKDEDRRKLWTTRHMMSDQRNYIQDNYLTTDPTYRVIFQDYETALEWFVSLGSVIPVATEVLHV
jgi:hypothetical protein